MHGAAAVITDTVSDENAERLFDPGTSPSSGTLGAAIVKGGDFEVI